MWKKKSWLHSLIPLTLSVGLLGACASEAGDGEATPEDSDTEVSDTELTELLPDEVRERGTLRNGADFTYPPMEYIEDDGTTFTGVDYDLAEEIGKRLGLDVEHHNSDFGTLIPALQADRVDMVISYATLTKEREETVDFVQYSEAGMALLVQAGNPEGIDGLSDLCGHTVGLLAGAIQVPLVEEQSDKCEEEGQDPITINQQAKESEVQLLLRNGRITADVLDAPVAAYAESESDGAFEMLPETYNPKPHGIMVLKDNEELRDAIQAALQEIIDDGTYLEILETYGVEDLAIDEAKINGALE